MYDSKLSKSNGLKSATHILIITKLDFSYKTEFVNIYITYESIARKLWKEMSYLQDTIDYELEFDFDDRKSTVRYYVYLGDNLIFWFS